MAVTKIGDYELLAKLGEGGMGAVFKARQIALDRVVALKILPPKLAANAEFTERFQREARATAKLNHPNVIAGIDVGQADGYHYFAMEYVEGQTFKDRIKKNGALPEAEVIRVGLAIASALSHAHKVGIVHRDVKPDNILLDKDGTPKLADLGLAKAAAAEAEDGSLTKSGSAVGTPHYIAPEQARGEKDIDGRADTYALGCTLYHAATGRTPFDGATTAVLMVKHLNEKMPHPQSLRPDLSDGFCAVLGRMVARNREDRYDDLKDAVEDLEALQAGQAPARGPLPMLKLNFLPFGKAGRSSMNPNLGAATPSSGRLRTAGRDSTGRLDAVAGERRTGKRDATEEKKNAWLPFAIGGGVVAALLLLYLVFGGKNTPPTEAQKPEEPKPKPSLTPPPPAPPAPPKATPLPPPPPIVRPNPPPPVVSVTINPAQPAPEGQTVIVLFNGHDLSNWRIERQKWAVEQGQLVGQGQGGSAYMYCRDLAPGDSELVLVARTGIGFHTSLAVEDSQSTNFLEVDSEGTINLTAFTEAAGKKILGTAKVENTTEFHTYRMVFRGTSIKVYVDGAERLHTEEGFAAGKGLQRQVYLFAWGGGAGDSHFKSIEARFPPGGAQAPAGSTDEFAKAIAAQPPVKQAELVLARLKALNPGFSGQGKPTIEDNVLTGLELESAKLKDLTPLGALKTLKTLRLIQNAANEISLLENLEPLRGLALTSLECSYSSVKDLTPLAGMPLRTLAINATAVSDLTPLQGLPLKELMVACCKAPNLEGLRGLKLEKLWIFGSVEITDLAPLQGMPITLLDMSYTNIADLAPLKGMKLDTLYLNDTKVTDTALLKTFPLTGLRLTYNAARDSFLKNMTTLTNINGQEPKDFFAGKKP